MGHIAVIEDVNDPRDLLLRQVQVLIREELAELTGHDLASPLGVQNVVDLFQVQAYLLDQSVVQREEGGMVSVEVAGVVGLLDDLLVEAQEVAAPFLDQVL